MRELLCRDAGLDCPHAMRAETDDQIMEQVASHAAQDHPGLDLSPALEAQIRSLIRDV